MKKILRSPRIAVILLNLIFWGFSSMVLGKTYKLIDNMSGAENSFSDESDYVIVVNSTLDTGDSDLTDGISEDGDGNCTLRAAIEQANYSKRQVSINFNIPGEGPHFIKPEKPLPTIEVTMVINGFSQPGSKRAESNIPAIYQIILDGSLVQINNIIGLDFSQSSDNSKVIFLKIQNFGLNKLVGNAIQIHGNNISIRQCYIAKNSSDGILITGCNNIVGGDLEEFRNIISGYGPGVRIFPSGNQNKIINNFIGTDPLGLYDDSEGRDGVSIMGSYNQVLNNLISGYESNGIILEAPQENQIPRNNQIIKNKIGINYSEMGFIPNGQGISINHSDKNIIKQNIIAGNNDHGIMMYDQKRDWNHIYSEGNLISQNIIKDNNGMGIDIGQDWVSENDPMDTDTGPNGVMNYPFIKCAYLTYHDLIVAGRIDSESGQNVTLEFFSNKSFDNTTYGEGEKYIGNATTDGNGSFFVRLPSVPLGSFITATATDSKNNTSEFSHYVEVLSWGRVIGESYDIYIKNDQCNAIRRITTISSADESKPSWSAMGDEILHVVWDGFQSRLAKTGLPFGTTRMIENTENGNNPIWDHNPNSILFDDWNNIYRLNLQTHEKVLLVEDAICPHLSSMGHRLLFFRPSDSTIRTIDTYTYTNEIVVISVNNPTWRGAFPVWSQDLRWIVFHDNGIKKIRVNHKGEAQNDPVPVIQNGEYYYGPAKFCKRDKKLVFHSTHESSNYDIWTINLDGTELQKLTGNSQFHDFYPEYSPNGRYVAYVGYTTQ